LGIVGANRPGEKSDRSRKDRKERKKRRKKKKDDDRRPDLKAFQFFSGPLVVRDFADTLISGNNS